MVILQLLPEVPSVQLQPMEIHFNYESQEHHLLKGEKQCIISFLGVQLVGKVVNGALLVSSRAIGIPCCLPLTYIRQYHLLSATSTVT